ncbi:MAG: hypothetical protein PVG07_14595 [Acidobacteriota bacterium]
MGGRSDQPDRPDQSGRPGRGGGGHPPAREDLDRLGSPAGLCATCRHAGILASKTSVFLRCGMAEVDPAFARYPRLPVVTCRGYERIRN